MQLLVQFMQKHAYSFEYRSEAWYQSRLKICGMSELATAIGCNYFSSPVDFVKNKIGDYIYYQLKQYETVANDVKIDDMTLDPILAKQLDYYKAMSLHFPRKSIPKMPILWGQYFENIIQCLVEDKYETRIYFNDICVKGPEPFCCSPDGLAILNDQCVLFEFKCPASRVLSPNKVPDEYIPQLLGSLDIIEPADYGLFITGLFRRCSRDDIGPKRGYNPSPYDMKLRERIPEHWGVSLFYVQDISCESSKYYIADGSNNPIDFGSISSDVLEQLFDDVISNKIISHTYIGETLEESLSMPNKDVANMQYIGFMGWKQYRLTCVRVEKEPGYLTAHKPTIIELFNMVDHILSKKTIQEATSCLVQYHDDEVVDY